LIAIVVFYNQKESKGAFTMIKRELIKPRKVVWVMRDFINDIHGLTHMDLRMPYVENETTDEWFERFRNAVEEEFPSHVKMVKSEKGFAICPDEKDEEEFTMFYNIESLWSRGYKQFAQNFFSRCPMGRGFASVTISILHEIGHMNAQQEFEGYDRVKALIELRENFPRATINFEYFKLPDEKAATDWAIEWLSHPENRRKAKAFEKKFFECFKKRG
jgi:hypothetical protein